MGNKESLFIIHYSILFPEKSKQNQIKTLQRQTIIQSDGTRVRWVFAEPIKTPETRLAFDSPVFVSRRLNENLLHSQVVKGDDVNDDESRDVGVPLGKASLQSEQDIGGISLLESAQRLRKADKLDRQKERERIKAKHKEQRLKTRSRRREGTVCVCVFFIPFLFFVLKF